VFVEYAKASPEDLLIQHQRVHRGPEPATLHVPADHLVRSLWWVSVAERPRLAQASSPADFRVISAPGFEPGERHLLL